MSQIKNQKNNVAMDSINIQVQMIEKSKNILNLGGLFVSDILNEKGIVFSKIPPKSNLKISDYLDKLSVEKLWGNELTNLENKYDVILLNDLLEQTKEPGLLLENLKSFLSENGSIILSIKNFSSFNNLCNILEGNITQNDILQENSHIYDLDKMISFLNNRNFFISEIKRIKQNSNFNEYDFPYDVLRSLLKHPDSDVISYVFRIMNKNTVNIELRNWLSEFKKNYFLENLKDKFHHYESLAQVIKDKDAHLEQVIKDKDAHLEQVIKDYKQEIYKIKNSKSWKLLHKFDTNND